MRHYVPTCSRSAFLSKQANKHVLWVFLYPTILKFLKNVLHFSRPPTQVLSLCVTDQTFSLNEWLHTDLAGLTAPSFIRSFVSPVRTEQL